MNNIFNYLVPMARANSGKGRHHVSRCFFDSNFGHMGGMGMGMIIFWLLVIMGIVYLVKNSASGKSESRKALDILEERYAKGEIEKEEFEAKKKDLSS